TRRAGGGARLRRPPATGTAGGPAPLLALRLPGFAAGIPADEHVGADQLRHSCSEPGIIVQKGQLPHHLPVELDPHRHGGLAGADARPGHQPPLLDELDRHVRNPVLVQGREHAAEDVVGVAAALDHRGCGRVGVAHSSRSSPSNPRMGSRYASGIGAARRSSRSTSTSVCVALTISASSMRYAAPSNVALVRPSRLTLMNTSSRSSNRAGAKYSSAEARITNSYSPSTRSLPRWRRYSTRAVSK